jgi:hypothetical protein
VTAKSMRDFLMERLDVSLRLLIGIYDFLLLCVHSFTDSAVF